MTTADAEARDITSFAASTHSRDNKDVAHTEQLLQAPLQSRAKAWLTELGMQGGEVSCFEYRGCDLRVLAFVV